MRVAILSAGRSDGNGSGMAKWLQENLTYGLVDLIVRLSLHPLSAHRNHTAQIDAPIVLTSSTAPLPLGPISDRVSTS